MLTRTHHLAQWATPYGRRLHFFKRRKLIGKQQYARPEFIGVQWFRTKAELQKAKAAWDKPLSKPH